ncbi:hypothetical protein ABPG72_016252 [Tetrahymena utriculariae]
MSNLIHEEQILVQDIFLIKTQVNTPSIKNGQEVIFLKDFSSDIQSQGQGFSLIKNESLFDSMLMERASIPNTNTLEYFCSCYNRALDQKDKPWNVNNQHSQDFIKYSLKITVSFAYLTLTSPELFESQWVDPAWNLYRNNEDLMAAKLVTFFEKVGFSYDFFEELDKQIQQEDFKENFNDSLLTIIIEHQRKMNILDGRHSLYISVLLNLLQFEHYKRKFISLKRYPFIPNSKGICISSDKELDQVRGIDLELRSALGPFLRISTVDFLIVNEEDKKCVQEMKKKVFLEFNNIRSNQQYNLQIKYYSELNQNYSKLLVELFKILLKKTGNYNYANDTLRFVAACIIGNKDKAKLYHRLAQQQITSSDAFMANILDVMLEITKIIFNKNDNKWEKIKPEFFSQSQRLSHLKEAPFYSKEKIADTQMQEEISEFGTITEYFFLCQQLAHYSIIPIFSDFKNNAEQLQRTEKEFKRMPQNNPLYSMAEQKVNSMKTYYFQYNAFLQMESRLYAMRDMYDLLFFLLPKWLRLDITKLNNNIIPDYKPSSLLNSLPENMITDVFEYHFFYTNFRRDYVKFSLTEQYINSFLEMTVMFLSNCQISSNPYLKAKLVEILFFFYHQDKSKVHAILSNSLYAKRNITASLMKFYIDIEFTGDSHQFYSKFNYRHYVNYLYTKLWVEETYQSEVKKLINEPLFERFINMLINDATYCTDEGISNMQKILDIRAKQDVNTLSPQDYEQYDRMIGSSAHFNKQSRETISLIANLSIWAPQPFLSDTFLDVISGMLNNFLKKMMDPTLNQYNIDKEFDFNSSVIVKDLIIIYSSLGHDKLFRQKVTADSRSFDYKLFETALKRVRKEQQIGQQIQEKFQDFLNNLVEPEIEEEYDNFPEEFQCAISLDILKDPVMLPSSKCVVERSIIKKALLDNEIDPFNRSPLKIDQLVEMPGLKKKIQDWKQNQKGNKNDEISDEQLEDALGGDIPDEFTCALSFCLLNDPVKLPTSHQNVERSMIKKALLDNEIDPFNRQPLKRDQLIELPELKKKLDEWKVQKKKELREKGSISSQKAKMDIEEEEGQYKQQQNLFGNLE